MKTKPLKTGNTVPKTVERPRNKMMVFQISLEVKLRNKTILRSIPRSRNYRIKIRTLLKKIRN